MDVRITPASARRGSLTRRSASLPRAARWRRPVMARGLTQDLLDGIVADTARKRYIHGFVMAVRRGDTSFASAAGNLDVSSRFVAASVTKLFVTAVILRLEAEGRLALDDRIAAHLPAETVDGLHVMNGIDRSGSIEVWHLVWNTSGIPGHFDEQT